jgi:hypothetical protein
MQQALTVIGYPMVQVNLSLLGNTLILYWHKKGWPLHNCCPASTAFQAVLFGHGLSEGDI